MRFGPVRLASAGPHKEEARATSVLPEPGNPDAVFRENGLLGNDRQLDRNFNVGVQLKLDLVLASHPDRAFRQTNFALLDFGTTGSDRVSNVADTDRAEQLAFFTGLGADGESSTLEGLGAGLGSRQRLSSRFLKLGTRFASVAGTALP